MNARIVIVLSDHSDNCTLRYEVVYKLSTDEGYTPAGNFFGDTIEIPNALADTTYDVKVTRYCCDGNISVVYSAEVDTTILTPPTTFAGTPADTQVTLNWDAMTDADNYVVEMADDAEFTTNLTEIYSGSTNSYVKTELVNGTEYFFRVRQQRTGYSDSAWSTTNATPTP